MQTAVQCIAYVSQTSVVMKKRSEETQTLRAGCSKAEPKTFRPATDPLPGGTGGPKFNQLEMVTSHYLYLQTQFGEDRCTEFRVIVVTDPLTHKHRHRQVRLQYTAPQISAQCSNHWHSSNDSFT